MLKARLWRLIVLLASLVTMALSWIAAPAIQTVFRFGKKRWALHTAPNPTAGGNPPHRGRFHMFEFRWSIWPLWPPRLSFASPQVIPVMIRRLGLTTALARMRYTFTEALGTGSTRLMTWPNPARYGNERGSPDGMSGARSGKSPHLSLSPAPA